MSQTFYRKYRPTKFSEIIGQKHIVQIISNSIKNDKIGHAYLFTGPRGTGKTTLARILAKTVNCAKRDGIEPCNQCSFCKNVSEGKSLDIVEIDAASNTGVDNIRELRETIKIPPSQLKYKIYIIDEVHMLSTGAFNALLKTLEEPPAHAIFILATTEIHKIPETIISRCQRFDFSRVPFEGIIKKIADISKKENIKIDKNSIEMIALAAEGGMRDAESILSQISSYEGKDITSKEVEEIIGATNRQSVEKIAEKIISKDSSSIIKEIGLLVENGNDLEIFNKALMNYFRQLMVISIDKKLGDLFSFELTSDQIENLKKNSEKIKLEEIINILDNLIDASKKIKFSFLPQLPLEVAIIRSINSFPHQNNEINNITIANETTAKDEYQQKEPGEKKTVSKQFRDEKIKESSPVKETKKTLPVLNISIIDIMNNWKKLLEELRLKNYSLGAFMQNCRPKEIVGNTLIISTKYNLHKDKLNEMANRLTIETALSNILGCEIRTKAELGVFAEEILEEKSEIKNTDSDPDISQALNIFGGKVV